MKPIKDPSSARSATLRSSALLLGSITVNESHTRNTAPLSGTHIKAIVFPAVHWLARRLPLPLAVIPARLIIALLRLAYWWPGKNRLRKACQCMARLNNELSVHRIYIDFLKNALGIIVNFLSLYRRGSDTMLSRIVMDRSAAETINKSIEQYGGAILAVPHNIGSAFSAIRINASFDMLLVAKNSATIERTRVAIDFYERMKLSVLMVRGGNPFELSRTLFSALGQGKLIAATLDNIDRTNNPIAVRIFNQDVGVSGWAAKIAVKKQVPIIPAWFHSSGRELHISTGSALMTTNIQAAAQHYISFFEQQIVRDPASWAYLADKHWQKILNDATE